MSSQPPPTPLVLPKKRPMTSPLLLTTTKSGKMTSPVGAAATTQVSETTAAANEIGQRLATMLASFQARRETTMLDLTLLEKEAGHSAPSTMPSLPDDRAALEDEDEVVILDAAPSSPARPAAAADPVAELTDAFDALYSYLPRPVPIEDERVEKERRERWKTYTQTMSAEFQAHHDAWLGVTEVKPPAAAAEGGAPGIPALPHGPASSEDEALVRDALDGGASSDVVCTRFGAEITRRDLSTATPGSWLNDEVINAYMKLLEARSAAADRPYVFSSFFYPKLCSDKFAGVARWTAKGPYKADLFARRAVVIPINVRNTHWCLAVVDMKQRSITYYDSLGGSGADCLKALKVYLEEEHKAKKNGEPLPGEWRLLSPGRHVPQQNNSFDCGVFACTFANCVMYAHQTVPESLASEADVNQFNQSHIERIRLQLQIDIIKGYVLGASPPA